MKILLNPPYYVSSGKEKPQFLSLHFYNSIDKWHGHLICTLVSENQGLDKSRSVSNLSGHAHLIFFSVHLSFFSVCHLDFLQVYGTNLKKILLTNWKKFRTTEKKFRCARPEIFLPFESDLNFSRPWFSEISVQIKWPWKSWKNNQMRALIFDGTYFLFLAFDNANQKSKQLLWLKRTEQIAHHVKFQKFSNSLVLGSSAKIQFI